VENEKTIERIDERPFNTKYGEWTLVSFLDSIHQQTHTALVKGNIDKDTPVCVRVHMENVLPSSFKISTITDAGSKPARRAKSQPASVCPGRINTPPGCAIKMDIGLIFRQYPPANTHCLSQG
jgi:hypothetical protein